MNWVQFFGACVVVVGSIWAARFTAHASTKAAATTASVAAAAVEVDREDRLIQNLERRVAAITEELSMANEREQRRVALVSEELDAVRRRLTRMDDEVLAHRVQIGLLRQYARTLRDMAQRGGSPVPPPPDGLNLDE